MRGPGATSPRLDMVMSVVCVRLLVPDASECIRHERKDLMVDSTWSPERD